MKQPSRAGAHTVRDRLSVLVPLAITHQGFRRYFANTAWMLGEQILRMVVGVLVGIWVARYLGPEQFGIFNFAIAFALIFGALAKLGLDGVVVRNLVRDPADTDRYLGTAFWLKVAGALSAIAAVFVALMLTHNDPRTNLFIVIIVSGLLFQSFEVVDFYFQARVLSQFVSLCRIAQLLISSALKVYLVLTEAELLWFVVVTLVDQVTLGVSLLIAYTYRAKPTFLNRFDSGIAKDMLRDSWPLILSGFAVMIYMRIDQIMIREMLGDREVGIYSASVRLSEVWYFIPAILVKSLFPAIVSAKKVSRALYEERLRRLYSFLAWVAILIALPASLLAGPLVELLYGAPYAGAGRVLAVQMWAGVFTFLGMASGKWFLSENLQKLHTVGIATGAVSNIMLNLILIPGLGIYGAAIASLLSYAVATYLMNLVFPATRENFVRLTRAVFMPFSHRGTNFR